MTRSFRIVARPIAVLLLAALAAAAPAGRGAAATVVGLGGAWRSGSWTPVTVGPDAAGTAAARVWVEDADGELVGSGPADSSPDGAARFLVRCGRPGGRALVEWADGTRSPLDLPPPLESTTRVMLVIGDLPGAECAARLIQRDDGSLARVLALADDDRPAPSGLAFDVADAVIVCGSALGSLPGDTLAALDDWTRRGGRMVFLAGASAAPPALVGTPAAAWLPGPAGGPGRVARMVPLRRTASIETYAKASRPLERGAVAGLEAPLLDGTAALDGAIEAWEGSAPTDLPLVVRRAHGFGTITWAGLDLDRPPFRNWTGSDTLLVELLGGRNGARVRGGAAGQGPVDLGGQLRVAIDRFPGVGPVPFEVVAGLALAYVACLYPLEWWLVRRSGRPWLAWLTLPALVAAFTAFTWWTGERYKGRSWQVHRADLVDVDVAGALARGTSFLGVWSPENARLDLAAVPRPGPPAAGAGTAALSWYAISGRGMGAVDAPAAHPSLATDPYRAGPPADRLAGVPLAASSSRVFEAEWSAPAAEGLVESSLERDAQGMLRGGLVSRLPAELRDCALFHAGWCYEIGTLPPGGRFDPLAGKGPRTLSATLTRSAAVLERVQTQRWRVEDTDVARILEIAGFHEAAGGSSYTTLEAGPLARLDLSALLPLDRAVLVGRGPPATDWSLSVGGAPGDDDATALWRIVIPLPKSPASRAADVPAEPSPDAAPAPTGPAP
ncbi:MAG: hypothetical protein ACKO3G_13505 [Planctomycetaceae bacterium]